MLVRRRRSPSFRGSQGADGAGSLFSEGSEDGMTDLPTDTATGDESQPRYMAEPSHDLTEASASISSTSTPDAEPARAARQLLSEEPSRGDRSPLRVLCNSVNSSSEAISRFQGPSSTTGSSDVSITGNGTGRPRRPVTSAVSSSSEVALPGRPRPIPSPPPLPPVRSITRTALIPPPAPRLGPLSVQPHSPPGTSAVNRGSSGDRRRQLPTRNERTTAISVAFDPETTPNSTSRRRLPQQQQRQVEARVRGATSFPGTLRAGIFPQEQQAVMGMSVGSVAASGSRERHTLASAVSIVPGGASDELRSVLRARVTNPSQVTNTPVGNISMISHNNPTGSSADSSAGTGERDDAAGSSESGRTVASGRNGAITNTEAARGSPSSVEGGGRAVNGRAGVSTSINQLHKASVVGDLTSISRFIKDGGNLEAQSFCGRTALHYAAFYGHADVARALILAGANVCSRGGGNSTPLHFAAWGGNKKVVRLLLDYGGDVEARDTEGNAPQAYSEDEELFQMLVQARRRPFPVPYAFLSRFIESRPVIFLAVYSTALVATVGAAVAIVLAWTTDGAEVMMSSPAEACAPKSGMAMGESLPMTVFVWVIGSVLVCALMPALILAVGYRRRTSTFWRSVKERDMEIVRIRHLEQLNGPSSPPPGYTSNPADPLLNPASPGVAPGDARPRAVASTPAANATSAAGVATAPTPADAATVAVEAFTPLSPRQVSRGEQAGQAVIARLSHLQAVASPTTAMQGPVALTGTPRVVGPRAAGAAGPVPDGIPGLVSAANMHRQAVHAAELARQHEVRRYHHALMTSGGAVAGGNVAFGLGNGNNPVNLLGVPMTGGFPGMVPVAGGGAGGRGNAVVQVAQ